MFINMLTLKVRTAFIVLGMLCISLLMSRSGRSQTLYVGYDWYSVYSGPIYTCVPYSYAQMVYTSDDLYAAGATGPMLITSIAFKISSWSYVGSASMYNNWTVYMANTSVTSLDMVTDYIPVDFLTEVFSGTVTGFTAGSFVEVELSTPFFWDGASNIVIAVNETSPDGWDCFAFDGWGTSESRALTFYYYDYAIDPASPPTGWGWNNWELPYLKIGYEEPAMCTDVPLVAGTLTGGSVCPSSPVSIINSGTTLASGITRIWQVAPTGTDDWTDIWGASAINLYYTDGIWEDSDFRCIVICEASGESDTTNVVTFTINPAVECYCIPMAMGCDYDAVINSFYTEGATVDVANMETWCSGGYGNYFYDYEVSTYQMGEFVINVEIQNSNAGLKIWIDWNQDGFFGYDELVDETYDYVAPGTVHSSFVSVPATAVPGVTRIRVAAGSWTTYFDECFTGGGVWGEVEDYALNIIPAPNCNEVDIVAGTLSDMSVCPSVPFILPNPTTTIAAGMERIWQKRVPSGTGTWTTIAGATSVNLAVEEGIDVATDYRCIVACSETGQVDTTNVAVVSLNSFLDCYCTPVYSYGCTWAPYINSVVTSGAIVDINNEGTGCSGAMGYADYFYEHMMTVQQLQEVTLSITMASTWSGDMAGLKAWIDFNQNGLFEGSEIVFNSGSYVGMGTHEISFTIPITAVPGVTRMRIRNYYWNSFFEACDILGDGEAEDYAVNIIPAPSCTLVESWPAETNVLSTPGAVCGSGQVMLDLETPMPLAGGITYQWEIAPAGTGDWTPLSPEMLLPAFLTPDITESSDVRCVIRCEGGVQMYSNTYFVESVVPETPTLYDGQTCGPGPVELTGEVGSGFIFWFEEPEGGVPFATGDVATTPELDMTTTFYAAAGAFPPTEYQLSEYGGASSMWGPGPFNIYYRRSTMQYLYTRADLAEAGVSAGMLSGIKFNMTSMPAENIPDYTISIKMMPASTMALGSWQTSGLTQVYYTPLFAPTETGWQEFEFDAPIFYDGNSAILVQICFSNVSTYWSSTGTHQALTKPGQALYYGTSDFGYSCGDVGSWTTDQIPNAVFMFAGCATERIPVTAYVREEPSIHIDFEDGTYCLPSNSPVIEMTASPDQPESTSYLWNTGSTSSSIDAPASNGETHTYWVEITDQYGCIASDTVHVVLNPSPLVDLGPDTTVCEGSVVVLDAGPDGVEYYWSNAKYTQTVEVNSGGTYAVWVTNEFGCMSTDTVEVIESGFAPSVDGIIVDNVNEFTFRFTPLHPENVIAYHWDFGDGIGTSTVMDPVYEYTSPGIYTVTLTVTSSCGTNSYITFVTIAMGADQWELSNNLKLYPNPTNQYLHLQTMGGIKMEGITVINTLGQVVYSQELNQLESLQLDVTRLPSGTYHIQIKSDKGQLTKSFQIVR